MNANDDAVERARRVEAAPGCATCGHSPLDPEHTEANHAAARDEFTVYAAAYWAARDAGDDHETAKSAALEDVWTLHMENDKEPR